MIIGPPSSRGAKKVLTITSGVIVSFGLATAAKAESPVPVGMAPVSAPVSTPVSSSNAAPYMSPVTMPNHAGALLAENAPGGTTAQPIDLTPVRLPERGGAFGPMQNFKTGLLYHLPSKFFFNATAENSLRLETNVFYAPSRNRADMIYRILPNINAGYAINRTTRVSCNYFMFRDQYAINNKALSRTIHSIGFRGDKDFQISPRTTLTTSFMARQLFITRATALSDLLPSVSLVRRVGTGGAIYASVLGQVRWQKCLRTWQEFDQFYAFGGVYRTPKWTFLADTTLIDNFGRGYLRYGPDSNHMIIVTLEADRKLSSRVPLTAFVRAEPIFNIGQEKRTGFAGFNFRLFGGIRAEISKPAIFPIKLRDS